MDSIIASVSRKYKQRKLNQQEQWPPVAMDKLANLQLVQAEKKEGYKGRLENYSNKDDTESGSKGSDKDGKEEKQSRSEEDNVKRIPISCNDLFKPAQEAKPVQKVIVEGTGGIGKTTLCTMLTEGWAQKNMLQEFKCVLLIPLREKSVAVATNLTELMECLHPDEEIRTAAVKELKKSEGEGVLILADGWDELSEQNQLKSSFLYNLLFGNALPFASVLLTSRPSASASLHELPCVDRLVEVMGFNEEDIKKYIETEFENLPKQADRLIEQLEKSPLVMGICSVPLNCAIICIMWTNKFASSGNLPDTLTKLYQDIVLHIILRDLKKKFQPAPKSLNHFDLIPKELQDTFWLICKFAYECLSRDQIVFTEEDLRSIFPEILSSTEKFLGFGLLHSAQSLLPSHQIGYGLSFHFAHLTIQEFLAALHLITLSNEEKLEVCSTLIDRDRFAMVWRFMFGVGSKKHVSTKRVVHLNQKLLNQIPFLLKDEKMLLCHCALELDSTSFSSKVASVVGRSFSPKNVHDYVAALHVIGSLSSNTELHLHVGSCGIDDRQLTKLTNLLSTTHQGLKIIELQLSGNKLTDQSLNDLFARAPHSLSAVQCLELGRNRVQHLSFCKLYQVKFNSLTRLSCSNNPLGLSALQSLKTAVQARKFTSLKTLDLSNILPIDEDGKLGAQLGELVSSIASNCSHLTSLDLSKNTLCISCVNLIGEAFPYLINGRDSFNLNLNETNLDTTAASRLSIGVLQTLSLMTPSTPNESYFNCTLYLQKNSLGCAGFLELLKLLGSKNCFVTNLDLDEADLTGPSTNLSPQSIETTLSGLNRSKLIGLSLQNISCTADEHLKVLESFVQHDLLANLEDLDLTNSLCSNVGDGDFSLAIFLHSLAKHCPKLKELDISKNKLSVSDCNAIGTAYPHLLNRGNDFTLTMNDAGVNSDGVAAFSAGVVQTLSSMTRIISTLKSKYDSYKLSLQENPLGGAGFLELLKLLNSKNCFIMKLDLDGADLTEPKTDIMSLQSIENPPINFHRSNLTTLSLENICCKDGRHLKALELFVQYDVLANLEELNLTNSLSSDADDSGFLLTTFLHSLAKHCPKLEELDLSKNKLSVSDCNAIGIEYPHFLNRENDFTLTMNDASVDGDALAAFSAGVVKTLSSMTKFISTPKSKWDSYELSLQENPLGGAGLLELLKLLGSKNCFITSLDLDGADLTEPSTDLLSLQSMKNLPTNLCRSNLTTLSLESIHCKDRRHLKILELFVKYDVLANLEDLYLTNSLSSNIGDSGSLLTTFLHSLAKHCPKLENLDLSENRLSVSDCNAIGIAYPHLLSRKNGFTLIMNDASVNSEAIAAFSAGVVQTLSSMTRLIFRTPQKRYYHNSYRIFLEENPLGSVGFLELLKLLGSKNCFITTLELDYANLFTEPSIHCGEQSLEVHSLASTLHSSKLTNLSLRHVFCTKNQHLKVLESIVQQDVLVNLKDLDLKNSLIDNTDVNGSPLNTFLHSLAKHCSKLEELDLSGNRLNMSDCNVIGSVYPHLVNCKNHFVLRLNDTNIDSNAIKEFSRAILQTLSAITPSATITDHPFFNCSFDLSIQGNPLGGAGFLELLKLLGSKNCFITSLDLDEADLTDPIDLKEKDFHLSTETIPSLYSSKLTELFLGNICCSESRYLKILEAFVQHDVLANLETLDLQNIPANNVNVSGSPLSTFLQSLVKHCPKLKYLDLSRNALSVSDCSAIGAVYPYLITNKTDFSLNLNKTNIGSETAVAFSEGVILTLSSMAPTPKSPKYGSNNYELDLRNNPLGTDGLLALLKMLDCKNCFFTSFDLNKVNLTEPNAGFIEHLTTQTLPSLHISKLTKLSLQDIYCTADGYLKIIEISVRAGVLSNLEKINLEYKFETSEDEARLTSFLQSLSENCPKLDTLDLQKSTFSISDCSALGKIYPHLAYGKDFILNLNKTNLNSQAVTAFAEGVTETLNNSLFPTTQEESALEMEESLFGCDGFLAVLKILEFKNCFITELNLDESDLTQFSDDIRELLVDPISVQTSSLTKLSLQNIRCTGAEYLKVLTAYLQKGTLGNLEKLNLKSSLTNDVSEEVMALFLQSLADNCSKLEDLDLQENSLSISDCSALGKIYPLLAYGRDFTLNLNETNLNSKAVTAFVEGVVKMLAVMTKTHTTESTKSVLHMESNPIGCDGFSAVIEMLESCLITKISLNESDLIECSHLILEQDIYSSADFTSTIFTSSLTKLSLQNVRCTGNRYLNVLTAYIQKGALNNLEELDLKNSLTNDIKEEVITPFLQSLADNCPKLKEVDLQENTLSIPECNALGKVYPHLAHGKDFTLNLAETNINSKAMTAFVLGITQTLFSRTVASCIGSKTCTLNLNGNPIGCKGLSAIFSILQTKSFHITHLELEETDLTVVNKHKTHSSIENISNSSGSSLTRLSLQNTRTTKNVHLSVFDVFIRRGIFGNLEELNLKNSFSLVTTNSDSVKLHDIVATFLSLICSHCKKLCSLNLSDNRLGEAEAKALGEVLLSLTSKREKFELELRNCHLNSESISAFSEGLVGYVPFTSDDSLCDECKLDFSGNPLEYKGMVAVLKMLGNKHCPITTLKLDKCISNLPNCLPSTFAVSSCDSNNLKLVELSLFGNYFHRDNIHLLAQSIQICHSVKKLESSECYITSHDFVLLLSLLKDTNIKLNEWNMSKNSIDDHAVIALMNNVPEIFPYLNKVDISENYVSDRIEEQLEEKLKVKRHDDTFLNSDLGDTIFSRSEDSESAVLLQLIQELEADMNDSEPETNSEQLNQLDDDEINSKNESLITMADLNKLYCSTFEARTKWKNILLGLGVPYDTIDTIYEKYRGNPDECYMEGLSKWLQSGERNWREVVEVFSSSPVGHIVLARKLQEEYVQHTDLATAKENLEPAAIISGAQKPNIASSLSVDFKPLSAQLDEGINSPEDSVDMHMGKPQDENVFHAPADLPDPEKIVRKKKLGATADTVTMTHSDTSCTLKKKGQN